MGAIPPGKFVAVLLELVALEEPPDVMELVTDVFFTPIAYALRVIEVALKVDCTSTETVRRAICRGPVPIYNSVSQNGEAADDGGAGELGASGRVERFDGAKRDSAAALAGYHVGEIESDSPVREELLLDAAGFEGPVGGQSVERS